VNERKLLQIIEGLLFASGDEGITIPQLRQILPEPAGQLESEMADLALRYESEGRGLQIIKTGNRYMMTTKPELSPYCQKLFETPQSSKLSQASLETLAIVAYRQPITKTEIEEIRGVKSDRPVQTLLSRELIEEAGRKDTPGKPILFRTTVHFLLSFGLSSLEELPPLPEGGQEGEQQEKDLFMNRLETQHE